MSEERTLLSARRLRACRESRRETLEEIGRLVGVNKSTVLRWERGDTAKINLPTMQRLARHYGVPPRWLMGLESDKRDDVLPEPETPPEEDDAYFWMRVTEDSMAPTIRAEDLLLVRRQARAESGDYVMVAVGEAEPVVKRIVYGSGWLELQNDNPYFPTRRFTGTEQKAVRLIGKVIESKRRFE